MRERVDYISQMVQDTFDHLDGGDLLSFSKGAARRKKNQSSQLEMNFDTHQARYDSERLCLVLVLNGEKLEIPVNWGPFQWCDFNNLDDSFELLLERYQDIDHLLDIFGHILNMDIFSFQLKMEANSLKIFFNRSEDQNLAA